MISTTVTSIIRLDRCLRSYEAATGCARRALGAQLRELCREFPALVDSLPEDVYRALYRVRARGTVAP